LGFRILPRLTSFAAAIFPARFARRSLGCGCRRFAPAHAGDARVCGSRLSFALLCGLSRRSLWRRRIRKTFAGVVCGSRLSFALLCGFLRSLLGQKTVNGACLSRRNLQRR